MARKVGQIIARGARRWLIRVYLGRDHQTKKRNYHNRTIDGSMREAQAITVAGVAAVTLLFYGGAGGRVRSARAPATTSANSSSTFLRYRLGRCETLEP